MNLPDTSILHLTSREAWQKCILQSTAYHAPSLETEGFIHCSLPEQIASVANTWYSGQRGLVLLVLDLARLTSEVRMEPGTDKPQELFPHVYGPINLEAVTRVLDYEPAGDGRFVRPEIALPASNISIRPAVLTDADLVADLVYLTMGVEADWLFGQEPGHSTHEVLTALYRRRQNRVSHPFAWIAALDGQDVGLLLAFPGWLLKRLDWITGLHLVGIFGLPATVRLARRQVAYNGLLETEPDEFYISNVAVLPEFQGRGVGKALMAHAEQLAREKGLRKCSLIVTYGHAPARSLYEKIGYETVRRYDIEHPQVAEGSGGYCRMVKVIA